MDKEELSLAEVLMALAKSPEAVKGIQRARRNFMKSVYRSEKEATKYYKEKYGIKIDPNNPSSLPAQLWFSPTEIKRKGKGIKTLGDYWLVSLKQDAKKVGREFPEKEWKRLEKKMKRGKI